MNSSDFNRIAKSADFVGAKIALICDGELVTYLRDDFAYIPDPNQWDLPGGECEPSEVALDCVIRETEEEFGIRIAQSEVIYASTYKSHQPGRADVAFFVGDINRAQIAKISFGEEGQCWRMMPVEEFLGRADSVKELRVALDRFLETC